MLARERHWPAAAAGDRCRPEVTTERAGRPGEARPTAALHAAVQVSSVVAIACFRIVENPLTDRHIGPTLHWLAARWDGGKGWEGMGWPRPVLPTKNLPLSVGQSISWPVHQLASPGRFRPVASSGPWVQPGPTSAVDQSASRPVRSQSLRRRPSPSARSAKLLLLPIHPRPRVVAARARHARCRDVCGVDSAAEAVQQGSAVYRRSWTVRAGARRSSQLSAMYRPAPCAHLPTALAAMRRETTARTGATRWAVQCWAR